MMCNILEEVEGIAIKLKQRMVWPGLLYQSKQEENLNNLSKTGWDSEMICYPYVFDRKGERYMLYNGNGYGKTGFGLAVLEGN